MKLYKLAIVREHAEVDWVLTLWGDSENLRVEPM